MRTLRAYAIKINPKYADIPIPFVRSRTNPDKIRPWAVFSTREDAEFALSVMRDTGDIEKLGMCVIPIKIQEVE